MIYLFSDYDGTIKTYEKDPSIIEKYTFKKNIKAIKEFIKTGNKFIITTGRSYKSILDETKKYHIDYNFVTAYDGLVTYDNNGNVLYQKNINKEVLKELKNIIIKYSLESIMYNNYDITRDYEDIIIIKLYIKDRKVFEIIRRELEKLRELNIEYDNIFKIITLNMHTNKSLGIKELFKNIHIEDDSKIITIGDSINDIEMIEDYNGYKILLSHPKLLFKDYKTTTSLHRLIKRSK